MCFANNKSEEATGKKSTGQACQKTSFHVNIFLISFLSFYFRNYDLVQPFVTSKSHNRQF